MKKIIVILFGLFIFTACSTAEPVVTTLPPQPTSTAVRVLPTSSTPGDSILWRELQVTMNQVEITEDFVTKFDSIRKPSLGDKFLWVHVSLKNVGDAEIVTPLPIHFGALYATSEFKPTYGHRKDHADYTSLDSLLFPDQEVQAWLRFDIPASAELQDLRFIFLPESSHVGVSFSSPYYPYPEDHPIFVWNCAP